MESRNIEKALEISAKLAAGETVSEQGTNAALYQEYSTNPEVYDMVLLSLKKMELSVYEYNNSLFAAPKAHGSLFGYSNEALRRELGLRTNRRDNNDSSIWIKISNLMYDSIAIFDRHNDVKKYKRRGFLFVNINSILSVCSL